MAKKKDADDFVPAKKKDKQKKSEFKTSGKHAGAPVKPSIIERLKGYFKGVVAELKRVVWPNRQEVINSTIIVLVTLIFFSIFTFVIDWLATGGMDQIIKLAAR
jgi:preprotein translocase subunit SecE